MSDTFITIVVVMAVVIIMFIYPISFIANQNEVIKEDNIKAFVSTFVNTVSKEGKITRKQLLWIFTKNKCNRW